MKESLGHFLHDCPNIDDNYGPQVVFKGSKCPFCGESAPELHSKEEEEVSGIPMNRIAESERTPEEQENQRLLTFLLTSSGFHGYVAG